MISIPVEVKYKDEDGNVNILPVTVSGPTLAAVCNVLIPQVERDAQANLGDDFVEVAPVHWPEGGQPQPTTKNPLSG